MRIILGVVGALFAMLCVACGVTPEQVPANATMKHSDADPAPSANSDGESPGWSEETIIQAIRGYKDWKRVADHPRFSPRACDIPPADRPFLSEADAGPHDRKLYYLYVKEEKAYAAYQDLQPAGQALVKESFAPVREADDSEGHATYRIGERKELFIMLKVGDGTAGEQTDAGWVYAIATADGSKITHAGRIDSCMRCHEDAGPSRLFGPKLYAPDESKPTIVGSPPG